MQVATGPSNEIKFRKLGFNTNSRGYMMEMKWNDGGSDFEENSTYEPKLMLGNGANTNSQTYLAKDTEGWPRCLPIPLYVTSSVPSAYLDTRALQAATNKCDNESTEVGYTVGSSYPKLIDPGQLYYTY